MKKSLIALTVILALVAFVGTAMAGGAPAKAKAKAKPFTVLCKGQAKGAFPVGPGCTAGKGIYAVKWSTILLGAKIKVKAPKVKCGY